MRCLDLNEDKPLPDELSVGSKSYDSYQVNQIYLKAFEKSSYHWDYWSRWFLSDRVAYWKKVMRCMALFAVLVLLTAGGSST